MRRMGEMRFGVSLAGWPDGPALLAAARTAEREGFDAVTVADHLGHTAPFAVLAAEVRRRLADAAHTPTPVQRPVPVMVAGMGGRALKVAGEHADVVGLAGAVQVPGRPSGTFTLTDAATTHE
jgi:alkanesulfonate monooxygenase SsuD/methylene tetrahydromethanopterin reductase-like flavin-dependent oxidoreductase (luciferase family)